MRLIVDLRPNALLLVGVDGFKEGLISFSLFRTSIFEVYHYSLLMLEHLIGDLVSGLLLRLLF